LLEALFSSIGLVNKPTGFFRKSTDFGALTDNFRAVSFFPMSEGS
jgi:hypothetical protein